MNRPQNSSPLESTPVQDEREQQVSQELSLRTGRVPTSVAGYEILRCLGEGSFGMVWLARERKTGRQVAIKFFTNRRGLDWSLLTREVEKLAVLDASRDVVRLLDVGWDHDPPYFVMEYLPHDSVATLLEDGPLPIKRAIEICAAVARALVHSHGAGILHCDIKPANILLDHADDARLSDFGQSRLSSDQSPALGTFYYMAPEQAAVDAVPDVRWDVYALGAVLYHMVTGNPPYHSEQTKKRLSASQSLEERLREYRRTIQNYPLPNEHRSTSGVDGELARLIEDCLSPDPSQRIPNAQVVLDRLRQRELNRSRRPLVWLGFLGPVLFLLMMLWIAVTAVPEAVQQAEQNLYERALTSDAATVRLLAASVDQELAERTDELERLAQQLIATNGERSADGFRPDMGEFLTKWRQENDERLKRQRRTLDISFFVNDRNGIQIYRNPHPVDEKDGSVGQRFDWRDYFHGLGRGVERGHIAGTDYTPRKTPGISGAFRSSNTHQYMVAVAVPIWNQDHSEVIGVLARTIHLTDLLSQWERRIRSGNESDTEHERFLSLVDMREGAPVLLDHSWMSAANLKEIQSDVELEKILALSSNEESQLERAVNGNGVISEYHDPLADIDESFQGEWLAAVANLKNVNWIAVVQERRAEAVAPMDELREIFIRYGQLMFVVFTAMLAVLGWLIRRVSS
ncbi:Serine/threonine-protein kinase PknB [Thalassoglobus neptunius]|uniref:Serine/threonine-protein kinase PknB n=1 Tax=Thalassoglobus neptunius TaxID=1938619 RepID=A0A5C5WNY3_9PLAN|nr:serine/threonine protein kinase [Thalassoglobus neptunius]TWT52348.1 Serine/threonine-protein kinase PknB [Thalassoglobus neptunius]